MELKDHAACVLSDSEFLIAGGRTNPASVTNNLQSHILDLESGSVRRLGDIQIAHNGASCVKMDANRVILAGHWFGTQVSVYDLAADQWTDKVEWHLPLNWAHPALVNVKGTTIIALGGKPSMADEAQMVRKFSPRSGWVDLDLMPAEGKSQHGKITSFRKLYPKPNC